MIYFFYLCPHPLRNGRKHEGASMHAESIKYEFFNNSRIHLPCRNNSGRIKCRFIQKLEIPAKRKKSKYFQQGRNKKSSKYFVVADI